MRLVSLDSLFHIEYGNGLELVNLPRSSTGINFVARTQKNNGVVARVTVPAWEHIFQKGRITVAVSGSVMESFVQTEDFVTAYHIMVLTPITDMTDELKLFYCSCLRMNKFKYSYGRQANASLPALRVPCRDDAETFVGNISILHIKTSMLHNINLSELSAPSETVEAEQRLVPLSSLFKLYNGISSDNVERTAYPKNDNWIPYIRPSYRQSTSIDAYVNRNRIGESGVYPKGTLYVSTDGQGSHTYAYVSVSEFVPNSNVTVLIPKRKMAIKEKLFYAMCITHNRFKFSYGRKPKGKKLAEILIPNTISKEFDTINIDNIIKK